MGKPHVPMAAEGIGIQAPVPDWAKAQVVTISGTSAQSSLTKASCVTLVSDTDCYVTWGANPTASATAAGNIFLAAGVYLTVGNRPGMFAGIQKSAGGTLFILPAIED